MGIPVSSIIDNSWKDLSDEEFMKVVEQMDESIIVSPSLS